MTIKGTIGFTYEWFTSTKDEETKEALKESAVEHVLSMMKQGYIEGQLLCEVGNKDYKGYWKSI